MPGAATWWQKYSLATSLFFAPVALVAMIIGASAVTLRGQERREEAPEAPLVVAPAPSALQRRFDEAEARRLAGEHLAALEGYLAVRGELLRSGRDAAMAADGDVFVSLARLCLSRVALLSAEAQARFRASHDARIAQAMEQDPRNRYGLLEAAVEDAWPASRGDEALLRLADVFLESGRGARAAVLLRRALDEYPTAKVPRVEFLARLGLCAFSQGDRSLLGELARSENDETLSQPVSLGAATRTLEVWLDTWLAESPPTPNTAPPQEALDPVIRWKRRESESGAWPRARLAAFRARRLPTPSVAGALLLDDRLYWHDGARLIVCRERDGAWLYSYPHRARTLSTKHPTAFHRVPAPTDDLVLASFDSELVALDRVSGRMRWQVEAQRFEEWARIDEAAPPGDDRALSLVALSNPVVAGDAVFLTAILRRMETRAVVFALERGTGRLRWQCAFASGPAGGYLGFSAAAADPLVVGDDLFVAAGFGVLALLDARTGFFRHAMRDPQSLPARTNALVREAMPLASASLCASETRLLALTSDSARLAAWDRATGRPRWSAPRGAMTQIVGVAGGLVWTLGATLDAYRIDDGRLMARHELPGGGAVGRGVLRDGRVIYADRGHVRAFELAGARFDVSYRLEPSTELPPGPGFGGHVFAGDESLAVCGLEGVAVLARRWDPRFEDEPGVLIRRLVALLGRERDDEALRLWDTMVARDPALLPRWRGVISEVEELQARRHRAQGRVGLALQDWERALELATDPGRRALLRWRLAALAREQGEFSREEALLTALLDEQPEEMIPHDVHDRFELPAGILAAVRLGLDGERGDLAARVGRIPNQHAWRALLKLLNGAASLNRDDLRAAAGILAGMEPRGRFLPMAWRTLAEHPLVAFEPATEHDAVARLIEEMRQAREFPTPVFIAHRFAAPPVIDGHLDDAWVEHEAAFLEDVTTVQFASREREDGRRPQSDPQSRWTGPQDLSARFYLGWDATNLYVAAVVRDQAHIGFEFHHEDLLGDVMFSSIDRIQTPEGVFYNPRGMYSIFGAQRPPRGGAGRAREDKPEQDQSERQFRRIPERLTTVYEMRLALEPSLFVEGGATIPGARASDAAQAAVSLAAGSEVRANFFVVDDDGDGVRRFLALGPGIRLRAFSWKASFYPNRSVFPRILLRE